MGFPVYIATADLDGAKFSLRTGQPFPIQSKPFIRGLGEAYGVKDARTMPFGDLPYVDVVEAGSQLAALEMVRAAGRTVVTAVQASPATPPKPQPAKRRRTKRTPAAA